MTFNNYYKRRASLGILLLLPCLSAQNSAILTIAPPQKLTAKRNSETEWKLAVSLAPGYHVNSNTPSESYLIPLKLTWTAGPLEVLRVDFPKPQREKYEFSPKPLSVFTGNFDITTRFKIPADATPGPGIVPGKLRYQACNNNACFAPKTIEVKLPVEIR